VFEMYHTCLVVERVEAAMEDLGALHPGGWAKLQEAEILMNRQGSVETANARFSYSMGEGPHLELVERVPGTVWDVEPGSLHHTGYWVSDLGEAAGHLEARGWVCEVSGGATDRPIFTYHVSPAGARVELVSRVIQPAFTRWIEGGEYQ
jgi:hypothetical protein